jgi:hypothetical protein
MVAVAGFGVTVTEVMLELVLPPQAVISRLSALPIQTAFHTHRLMALLPNRL